MSPACKRRLMASPEKGEQRHSLEPISWMEVKFHPSKRRPKQSGLAKLLTKLCAKQETDKDRNMRIQKAVGTIGVKQDGRQYGTLPVSACKLCGIDPEGRVDIVYLDGVKGQRARLIFTPVAKHAKLKGQVVVKLKHAKHSRFAHFEQQGVLFKGPLRSEDCDIEVHDDKLHLLLPIGMTRRSPFKQVDPVEEAPERRAPIPGTVFDAGSSGLSDEGNAAAQAIVEAIQRIPGCQMRIFDVIRGRHGDCDPQAMWDQLLSEIY